jgi:hypothetical protein
VILDLLASLKHGAYPKQYGYTKIVQVCDIGLHKYESLVSSIELTERGLLVHSK